MHEGCQGKTPTSCDSSRGRETVASQHSELTVIVAVAGYIPHGCPCPAHWPLQAQVGSKHYALMLLQTELGRDLQGKRWGPRPLDLDIIFYEGLQHKEEGLEIPHPRWQERTFVQAMPLL